MQITRNDREKSALRDLKKRAEWDHTSNGLRLASVKTDFLGVNRLLHQLGAQIAVVLNPRYRLRFREMKMFTISSNKIELNTLLPDLNSQEGEWKIIRNGKTLYSCCSRGSGLTLKKVFQVVQKKL